VRRPSAASSFRVAVVLAVLSVAASLASLALAASGQPDVQVPADGYSKAVVVVTLKNTHGQPMVGVRVEVQCGGSVVVTPEGKTTDANGVERFDVTDSAPQLVECDAHGFGPAGGATLDERVTIQFTLVPPKGLIDPTASSVAVEGASGTLVTGTSSKTAAAGATGKVAVGGSGWSATAASFRGQLGKQVRFECPPDGKRSPVVGSNPYTDQSSVCTAAVNFGLITVAAGGLVTVSITSGNRTFAASNRNGTSTLPASQSGGSFSFSGSPKVVSGAGYGGDGWSNGASQFRGQDGKLYVYSCPAGDHGAGSVYGTDTYMDSSPVCTAAVHAGVITPDKGGDVTVEIRPGLKSYQGSDRNGVKTQSWGPWAGSYIFVKS
jgi:hypothetical protein